MDRIQIRWLMLSGRHHNVLHHKMSEFYLFLVQKIPTFLILCETAESGRSSSNLYFVS